MSVGIIGGADGPTAIFISRNSSPWTIGAVIAVAALAVGCVLFIRKRKKKN